MIYKNVIHNQKYNMRHIFQLAILIEEKGTSFYSYFKSNHSNQKIVNLFTKLVLDEIEHRAYFQDVLSHWLPLPSHRKLPNSLIKLVENYKIFKYRPRITSSEESIILYGIEQEEKMINLYSSLKKYFPQLWKRLNIQKLINAENEHKSKLIKLLNELK